MSPFGNFNLARQELKKVALKALYKLRKEMETPQTPEFDDSLPGRCKKGRGERRKHHREKGEFEQKKKRTKTEFL